MADVAAEVKDKEVVSTPEKEVPEKKVTKEDEAKETDESEKSESEQNGDTTNGVGKDEETKETLENGDTKEPSAVKRKSDAADGNVKEGVSPEKKAKLEEKVENGEAETTA